MRLAPRTRRLCRIHWKRPEALTLDAPPVTTKTVPMLDLTVVVPVYRNAPTLAPLCHQLKQALAPLGIAFELLFVNDGSTDNSAEVLAALALAHDEVTVLDLARNRGQQVAILCGLDEASGRSCAIMDADLQDPPSALPLLWAARRPGVEAVFAGRRGRSASFGRHVTSALFRGLLHVTTGLPYEAGMFMIVERPLVAGLLSFPTEHPWLTSMIGCLDVPCAIVPVKRMERPIGRSSYTSLARVRAAITGIRCVIAYRLGLDQQPYLKRHGDGVVQSLARARVVEESAAKRS